MIPNNDSKCNIFVTLIFYQKKICNVFVTHSLFCLNPSPGYFQNSYKNATNMLLNIKKNCNFAAELGAKSPFVRTK